MQVRKLIQEKGAQRTETCLSVMMKKKGLQGFSSFQLEIISRTDHNLKQKSNAIMIADAVGYGRVGGQEG